MMKLNQIHLLFLGLIVAGLNACTFQREAITPYAPLSAESYPADTILKSVRQKKAMVVIAHDDDMCAMTGTISLLNKTGWEICVLSFHQGEARDAAHRSACKNIVDTVTFFNLTHAEWRLDLEAQKNQGLYLPIPKSQFGEVFATDKVQIELIERIQAFQPSVLLTLDNEIGAYGHPEHVFISQLVLDLFKSNKIPSQHLFQSVYTPHMASSIMKRHAERMKSWGFSGDGWEKSKEVYQVSGMPLPTTEINVESEAKDKMSYLKSYNKRERKTIGFYVPAFEDYAAKAYFRVFNREFFRVMTAD